MTGQEIEAVVLDSIPLREAGQHQEALELVEDALARDPEVPTLLSLKGAILDDLGRYEEALALHEAALEHAPRIAEYVHYAALQTAVIWHHKGNALYSLQRYQEALASYEQAIRFAPDDPMYWKNKSNALHVLRRYAEAIEALRKAGELAPDDPQVWLRLSVVFHDAKQFQEALAAAEHALALADGDEQVAEAWWRKAQALMGLRRQADALATVEQACTLQPNNLTYWEHKTALLFRLGRLRAGWKALWHTESMFHRWRQWRRQASRAAR